MLAAILGVALLMAGQTIPFDIYSRDGYGDQCTGYVTQYVHDNYGYWIPGLGAPKDWPVEAPKWGYNVGSEPCDGAILMMQPYRRGNAGPLGHVAIVTNFDSSRMRVLDRNWKNDQQVDDHWVVRDPSDMFLYLN
jgi:surface antigen